MGKFFGRVADFIRETDKVMLLLCIAANCFGCVAVYSATAYKGDLRAAITQVFAMVLGIIAACIISLFDYNDFLKLWPVAAAVGLIPVFLTFFIGYAPAGTDDKAWLSIFGVSFQPSELLKIMFIITFTMHLSRIYENINQLKYLIPACIHGAIPVLIVHLQGDDGTAIVFVGIMLGMLCAAGLKLRYIGIALAAAVAASPFLYFFVLNDDQRSRIINMFSADPDIKGAGYQQYRGRVALANGGLFGQGFRKGPLTSVGGVPEGHNDFIFTSIGEEFGFVGCVAVILLLAAICVRLLIVSQKCTQKSGTFICVGLFSMLLVNIIINIGMCLSVLPVIGITLPFFSAGGTALLCLYLGVGLELSVWANRNSRTLYLG